MATLEEIMQELRSLRTGQDELRTGQDELRTGQDELRTGLNQLRTEVREEFRVVRGEMAEGFERVELKVQKVRSDIHQLDKDLNKHMEVHRELEEEVASIKKTRTTRVTRPTRPRR